MVPHLTFTLRQKICAKNTITGFLGRIGDFEFIQVGDSIRVLPCPVSGSTNHAFSIVQFDDGTEYYTAFNDARLQGFEEVPRQGTVADLVCGMSSSLTEVSKLLSRPRVGVPSEILKAKNVVKETLRSEDILRRHQYYVQSLWATPAALDYLVKDRGLSKEIIMKSGLGWSENRKAVSYPYYSDTARTLPVHMKFKMRSGYFGHSKRYETHLGHNGGGNLLFNEFALERKAVWIVEGEHDALQLEASKGISAVALSGNFSESSERYGKIMSLRDRTLFLAFDCDAAGEKYLRAFEKLSEHNRVVRITCAGGGKDPDEWCLSGKQLVAERWMER